MIRLLSVEDLPCLQDLQEQVQAVHVAHEPRHFHAEAPSDEYQAHLMGAMEEGGWVLAAFLEGRAVGYLLAVPDVRPANAYSCARHEMVLDQICVDASYQRRGIGRALVAAFETEVVAREFDTWRASHWAFNDASATLLERCGAVPSVILRRKVLLPDQ